MSMYGALWRILPGPVWVRVIILIAIAAGVVYALFTWVFAWVDGIITPRDVTVEQ